MAKTKVRFNLSRGKNYMKWKIAYPDGSIEYIDPNKVRLTLKKCHLKNNPKAANKILAGANKTVCAWILCDEVIVEEPHGGDPMKEGQRLRFNPRVAPNWMFRETNVDLVKYHRIESRGSRLYVIY